MSLRRGRRNAIFAGLQVIATGAILFFLYRHLVNTIGVELLGVWSLVMATSSILNAGNLGLTGSSVVFVSRYLAKNDPGSAAKCIETSAISIFSLFIIVIACLYPVITSLLERGLADEPLVAALNLLPFALASILASAVSAVFTSALDGCLRTDIRCIITIACNALYLALAYLLVDKAGLIGLGYAQLGQSLAILLLSWACLKKQLNTLSIAPHRWDRPLFVEMFRYGMGLQLTTFLVMLFDPVTKWLMTHFGGLSATGYYEMANRMISQFRAVIIAANQVIVPIIAREHLGRQEKKSEIYIKNFRLIAFLATPYFFGIICAAPLISRVWIGDLNYHFIAFTIILTIAAYLHTLIGPAYFQNLGTGKLKWNITAHFIISFVNIPLAGLLGSKLGALGVATGSAVALVIGSSIVILSYHREQRIQPAELKPFGGIALFATCCLATGLNYLFLIGMSPPPATPLLVALCSIYLLSVLGVLLRHPILKDIQRHYLSRNP